MNFIKRWLLGRAIKQLIRRFDMSLGKGWRTIAANVLGGLLILLGWDFLTQFVDPKIIAEAIVVINLILRWLTTTPVGNPQ